MRAGLLVLATSLAHAAPPVRVAVLTFESGAGTAGELGSIGAGLQSMVTTDLAQAHVLEIVERSRLHDIVAELRLGQSGLVDKSTAMKIGKLAGATHLVAGTFTIVGPKMRLDARVFAIADGRVLVAEAIEGEKDAFFELEKDLVQKLVRSFGVAVAPRERAEMARIHTADFAAFQRYSDGIALFDEKRFDEALAALRDAEARDASFKLATLTLAEYERVIGELRAKAGAIETAKAELERAETDARQKACATEILRLLAVAAKPGRAAAHERLRALAGLLSVMDPSGIGGRWAPTLCSHFADSADRFASERSADGLWRRYFAEWSQLFPHEIFQFGDAPGPEPAGSVPPTWVLGSLDAGKVGRSLLMDRRQEADLRRRFVELAAQVPPGTDVLRIAGMRRDLERDLAENLRAIGDYDASTAVLAHLGAAEKDPSRLKELAREVETNRALTDELTRSRDPAATRELQILGVRRDDPALRDALASARALARWSPSQSTAYVLVGTSPVWLVSGSERAIATGRRTDPLRATELRYRGDEHSHALAIVDGVERSDPTVELTLSFVRAADFGNAVAYSGRTREDTAHLNARIDATHAAVGLAFAIRDVERDPTPMRYVELVVAPDKLRLIEVERLDRRLQHTSRALGELPLESYEARELVVRVQVGSDGVRGTVGGKPFAFPAPAVRRGFVGLSFLGLGCATLTSFKVAGGAP